MYILKHIPRTSREYSPTLKSQQSNQTHLFVFYILQHFILSFLVIFLPSSSTIGLIEMKLK